MRTLLGIVIVAGSVLAGVGIAAASSLTTPAIQKEASDSFRCVVVNNKSTEIAVDIEIRSSTGTILNSVSQVLAQPGTVANYNYAGTFTEGYCVVTGALSKKLTPVTFCAVPNGALRCAATTTAP